MHFGEVAAIDGKSRSASVVAIEPTTLACLSGKLFVELCHQHPAFAISVMRNMAEIMRRFIDRVVTLSTLGAHNRVHAELLRLARTHQGASGALMIRPIPRHGEIAARVSTTRETVARVLADLAHENIVARESDALVIRDPRRLSVLVEKAHK
jgi:CRP-like cAMP-binding protein